MNNNKAEKGQTLSATQRSEQHVWEQKEPQLIQTCSVGVSGKTSQEVAFDPGRLIPTHGSSSPLFLGGGVGVLKDNGKGKAVRRLNLRQLNLLTEELLALPWIRGSWLLPWKCVLQLHLTTSVHDLNWLPQLRGCPGNLPLCHFPLTVVNIYF